MRLLTFLSGALLLAGTAPLSAQTTPAGDGLRGDYYAGRDFERYVASRYDPVVDFDWQQRPPLSGVPDEDFSVRWSGWLVPPTTGEYVLAVLADDGARLWLNGRQLLNEWRGQGATLFQVKVRLQAGQPYRLRLDYNQYRWETRVRLSWQPPNEPATPLPTRYLFRHNPIPPPKPAATVAPAAAPVAAPTPVPTTRPGPVATRERRPTRPRPVSATAARVAPAPEPRAVSAGAAALGARLASGRALTMRTLYFEQGRASLLPAVQASLDTLAEALRQRPALRLQVQGHTDNQGDSVLNRQLSQRRAEAVCQYLATHGVAPGRLRPLGLGGRHPVADNRLPAERPRNRRVVLVAE